MKLCAFGDSFVEGLIKEPIENHPAERRQINFVTQLEILNPNFDTKDNHGLRGNANQKIAYDAYKHIKTSLPEPRFYLITFSGRDRNSHYYPDSDEYHCCGEEIYAKEQPQFMYEAMILLLHNVLDSKKIPHLFLTSFEKYRSNMVNLKNLPIVYKTLAQISKDLAPCLHPTEAGHKNIAMYLNELVNIEIDKYKV